MFSYFFSSIWLYHLFSLFLLLFFNLSNQPTQGPEQTLRCLDVLSSPSLLGDNFLILEFLFCAPRRCNKIASFTATFFDEGEMGILSGMNPIPILSAAFNSTAQLHRPAPLNGEQTKGLAKNSQAGSPSHFGFCPKCVNDCIGGAHIRCKSSIFLKRILETILLSQSI